MSKTQILGTCADSGTRPLQRAGAPSQYKTSHDHADNRTLYILGFGLLGAILANMLVLIYDASFYMGG